MAKKRKARRHSITFTQPTLTQQHSRDEVNINNIMARYIKTGVIDHVAKYQPQYTQNSEADYHQSMNIIREADEMFLDLPSQVRQKFENDPAKFLDYVNDPENHEKLHEIGLTNQSKVSPISENTPTPLPNSVEDAPNSAASAENNE